MSGCSVRHVECQDLLIDLLDPLGSELALLLQVGQEDSAAVGLQDRATLDQHLQSCVIRVNGDRLVIYQKLNKVLNNLAESTIINFFNGDFLKLFARKPAIY